MFPPDAIKFGGGVFRDLMLDVADIALVEIGGLAVLENHEIEVLVVRQSKPGKNFQRGACDTTWMGRTVRLFFRKRKGFSNLCLLSCP